MTQLRFHPNSISNYFDRVLAGIGKRGSSFSDIDAVSHDRDTNRFLVQEFKRENESVSAGQHWLLHGLAAIPRHFTVWLIVRLDEGQIRFAVYGQPCSVITEQEYQARFRRWWNNKQIIVTAPVPFTPITAKDIQW